VLIHFIAPHGKLDHRLLTLEQVLGSIPPVLAIADIRSKMRKETVYEKLSCHLLDMEMA
jgi:hypothetical protein